LTRQRVLQTAVEMADDCGIAGVTMRRLGQQLGVEAMSLYNHVADKDDLIDGMVDVVVGEVGLPAPWEDWRSAIRAWADTTRTVLMRHPWALWVIKSRRKAGPSTLCHHDAVIGCLREAGFSTQAAGQAFALLRSYTFGFALHAQSLPIDVTADAADAIRRKFAREVSAEEYPHLAALLAEHVAQRGLNYDRSFAFGLELILDGLDRVRDNA
jgi:AcrR family transcriptional regulator